jgi:hypothetical protein
MPAQTGPCEPRRQEGKGPPAPGVFEAGYGTLHRAAGHPDAPIMVDSMIGILRARLMAVSLVRRDSLSDDDYCAAPPSPGHLYRVRHESALVRPARTCRQAGHVRAGDRRERAQHLLR